MVVYDGKIIPFPDNYFDVVIVSFVLHHIPDQKFSLNELRRVAKRMIVLEDLPSSCWFHPSHIVSRFHYYFFDQHPGMINHMHSVNEWFVLFEEAGWKLINVNKIPGSVAYPCEHVRIICE